MKRKRGGENPFEEPEDLTIKMTDGPMIQRAFATAVDGRDVVVDTMLRAMTKQQLKDMVAAIGDPSKTKHSIKLANAVDCIPQVADLAKSVEKMTASHDAIKTKISGAIWRHVCQKSGENAFNISIFKAQLHEIIDSKVDDDIEL
jgi:hypothetical protein